ncbi:hypothetical protein NUU61_003582 [Penicillium alfredii]|uniref:Uncharacterized protein n=1 Tax=Penicillium alfredii TaxID=1506179 RepID=A0A9W9FJP4_9EURO|nr:uncharacterized protein NUU61_003582 [Penicillium alfredii]KAJ5101360.1 hypothetical protein NUU61_003582 [Penicillium alfredii]
MAMNNTPSEIFTLEDHVDKRTYSETINPPLSRVDLWSSGLLGRGSHYLQTPPLELCMVLVLNSGV